MKNDDGKSREQLISELAEMRRLVDELTVSQAELKRVDDEIQLLQNIITDIWKAANTQTALHDVLKRICETTGWVYGEVWLPNSDGSLLERSPVWYSSSDRFDEFGKVSESFTFNPGAGLPGRVWASKTPIWIEDVTQDRQFLRAEIACKVGLKTALGIPILANNEVVAVMVYYLFDERVEDDRFVKLVFAATAQMGSIMRHKQVEDALLSSENHCRSLIESSQDCICDISLDGKYRSMNAAGLATNGFKRLDDVIGRSCTESIIENRHDVEEALRKAASGETVAIRYKSVSKTGREIWWDSKITPIKSGEGGITGILRISRDITDRKKSEEDSSRLIDILEATSDFVATADMNGNVLYYNRAARRMLGIGDDEDISKIRIPDTHPDWATRIIHEEAIPTAVRKGIWSGETAFLSRDGREIPVSQVVIAHKSVDGEVKFLSTIARDLTEIRKTEGELLFLKKAVETMQIGVTLTDADGNILYTNPAEGKMHGYEVAELMGRNVKLFAPSASWNRLALNEMYETVRTLKRESVNLRKDGSSFPVQLLSDLVIDSSGRVIGIVTCCEDITERKMLEEELLKVGKLESISTLSGGIAHDFNNILTIILGRISLAKMHLKPGDEIFDILGEAEKGCKRARDLTSQLLTFSKGGAPIKKTIQLPELIKETTALSLSGSNVRVEYSFQDGLRAVEADEGQMSQVFNSILINAIHAMPNGGVINVKAENATVSRKDPLPLKEGEYVIISISDQGVGIPEEHMPRIFDPFFTTKQKGSGLGLATSYSIVRKHEGYITVKSEHGSGSMFYIYLPASARIGHETVKEEKNFKRSGRILIMDDEEILRDSTRDLLAHLGYKVETAVDGLEAIHKYKAAKETGAPFDIVIMDLTVPGGMGGKDAVKKLLEFDPGIRAIVSSGYSNDPVMADFKRFGFSGVVVKPYKIDDLRDALDNVMAGK